VEVDLTEAHLRDGDPGIDGVLGEAAEVEEV
jgi:hypothetical protein